MNILFWGLTLGTIGKILIAVAVLIAHGALAQEGKVDKLVLRSFKLEHAITIIGIILVLLGYYMEVHFYGYTPFLTCEGTECSAAVNDAFNPVAK
jgi:hypothetical protein